MGTLFVAAVALGILFGVALLALTNDETETEETTTEETTTTTENTNVL
jgi:hypothetical protein